MQAILEVSCVQHLKETREKETDNDSHRITMFFRPTQSILGNRFSLNSLTSQLKPVLIDSEACSVCHLFPCFFSYFQTSIFRLS